MSRPQTVQTRPESPVPMLDFARTEEADDFARTVKEFRQGRYPEDMFRRYRLQHGAYGTRMTSDYAMIRIKIPARPDTSRAAGADSLDERAVLHQQRPHIH